MVSQMHSSSETIQPLEYAAEILVLCQPRQIFLEPKGGKGVIGQGSAFFRPRPRMCIHWRTR